MSATKPASVLVPIVDRREPTVLLTQRTADLASHAGQVAFPGGKIDPSDESPVAAALREAKEEVGLAPSAGRADRLSRPLSDLLRLPHSADGGARQAGLYADAQSERSHRGVRSAARFSDESGKSPAQDARLERHCARILCDAVRRRITFGASPRVFCAISTSGFTAHDQADLHRNRAVCRPVRPLRGVSCGDERAACCNRRRGRRRGLPRSSSSRCCLWCGSFLVLAQFSGAPPGSTYVPAHIDERQIRAGRRRE